MTIEAISGDIPNYLPNIPPVGNISVSSAIAAVLQEETETAQQTEIEAQSGDLVAIQKLEVAQAKAATQVAPGSQHVDFQA